MILLWLTPDVQYGLRSTTPLAVLSSRLSSRPSSPGRSRSNWKVKNVNDSISPDGSSLPKSPPRSSVPLPTPRGFFSPKKPAAAVRLEHKERERAAQAKLSESDAARSRLPDGQSSLAHISNVNREAGPLGIEAMLAGGPGEEHPPDPGWDRSLSHSVTDSATLPHPDGHDMSSDHLVNRVEEKSNGAAKPPTGRTGPSSRSPKRLRRYTKFENPQTTWFCGGYLMTGGDSLISVSLALVVLFGLTGVWLGTTGAWLWKHGSEYGFARGGGIAIVIILVLVALPLPFSEESAEYRQISVWCGVQLATHRGIARSWYAYN